MKIWKIDIFFSVFVIAWSISFGLWQESIWAGVFMAEISVFWYIFEGFFVDKPS